MKDCTSCIHFKSCEDWAKSFLDPKKAEFPFRTENETEVALCEFYENENDYRASVVQTFLSIWRNKITEDKEHGLNSRFRSFFSPDKTAEAAANLAVEALREMLENTKETEEKCKEKSEVSEKCEEESEE